MPLACIPRAILALKTHTSSYRVGVLHGTAHGATCGPRGAWALVNEPHGGGVHHASIIRT